MNEKEVLLREIISIVGEQHFYNISVGMIPPRDMEVIELKQLIKLLLEIKKRREKKFLCPDQFVISTIAELLYNDLSSINISGLPVQRMDKLELIELEKLVRLMKLREKGYQVIEDRFELEGEYIKVEFNYSPYLVEKMRLIPTADYKKPKKAWFVHLSQWPAVEELFRVTQPSVELAFLDWREHHRVNRLRITNRGCYLTGLELPIDEIHLATSFPDVNAKRVESYQNGSWDGRIALFDKGTGFVPFGLIGKVLAILKKHNINYEFKDERVRPEKHHSFGMNVNLRDYQENTLSIAMNKGRGILQLATGAGKTKTASAIVSTYGMNTIFFVHTKFLLSQAKEALEEVLGIEVGQVGDGIVDIKPVTVAMVQTTIRALGDEYKPSEDDAEGEDSTYFDDTDISKSKDDIIAMLDKSEVIFFDECQFVAAETFYKIANYCNAYYKYGLSATPYRSDKKDLMIIAALGPVIDKINASYLIKRGFLTKPMIHYFNIGVMKGQDERNYQQVYREEIVENSTRNSFIVQSTQRLNKKNKSVLILVQQVNHGKILQEMFRLAGQDVEFVYGLDNIAKRDLEVYKLRTKKKLALIATTIADEGLDVPSLDAVVLGGGGKSPSKGMQRIGRAIRVFGDNEEAFEIFNSTKQLLAENKNTLIVVDTIEKGKLIQDYFASSNPSRNKKPMEIDFYYGRDFIENKTSVYHHFTKKDMMAMIVFAEDISEEEIMSLEPVNAILISMGEKFDSNKIQRVPNNISTCQLKPLLIRPTEEEKAEGKKDKDTFDATDLVEGLLLPENIQKSTLILVDETKYANAIKDFFKEKGIKIKYMTGAKQANKVGVEVEKLANKETNLLMVNSTHVVEAIDYHLIDQVIIVCGDKPAYKSTEDTQKDVRIFTKKNEAYVIDFIDNVRYCHNHSLERRMMFETESEFVISGWK